MIVYNCDICGGTHEQVHILLAEDEMGIISVVTLCNDCSDEVEFDYEYLMSLKSTEETDKYGLFS